MFEPLQIIMASLIVLASNKVGTLRFYINYCKAKAVTIQDSYPIPQMVKCIEFLGDITILSKLHAAADICK